MSSNRPSTCGRIASRSAAGRDRHHEARDAEMIRPEPHQPLDEADLGRLRRHEPRARLAADEALLEVRLLRRLRGGLVCLRRIDRLRRIGSGCRLGRLRGLLLHGVVRGLGVGHRHCGGALLLGHLLGDLGGLPRFAEIERRHGGLGGGQQGRVDDLADARLVELGQKRAARVGCDRGDRARHGSGPRAEAEAMQRQRRLVFRIRRHGRVSRVVASVTLRSTRVLPQT